MEAIQTATRMPGALAVRCLPSDIVRFWEHTCHYLFTLYALLLVCVSLTSKMLYHVPQVEDEIAVQSHTFVGCWGSSITEVRCDRHLLGSHLSYRKPCWFRLDITHPMNCCVS